MEVRPFAPDDGPWVDDLCRRFFGSEVVTVLGRSFRPAALPGLVATHSGHRMGALAYLEEADGAQVVLLAAEPAGRGAGTVLLCALEALGMERFWERLWLLTGNDNTLALRFYQRRGWDLVALHRGAVAGDRRLKPEIPRCGVDGIPLRHLLELERRLRPGEEAGR